MKSESEISSRLKALREKSGLSVRKTAAAINMTATTYQYYEQGFKKPHLPRELALALADVFSEHGVSQAEVLALAGEPVAPADTASSNDRFGAQIQEFVRLFTAVPTQELRDSRFEMIRILLEDVIKDQPASRKASRQ